MNTAARWVCSFAGAVALACGGQVDTWGGAPVGGSAGNSAGTAGSGAGAGSAGSDGRGGVAGSSGGVAGSSGGVAGSSGGVAGSSGGVAGSRGGGAGSGGRAGSGAGGAVTGGAAGAGGAPPDVFGKMRQACAVLYAGGCFPGDCFSGLSSFAQQIAGYGCMPQFVAALDCVIATKTFCEDMSNCSPAMEGMTRCVTPNVCTEYGSSDGSCGAVCGDWAADCRPGPSGRLSCVCTQGPQAGVEFVPNEVCSSPNWQSSVRAFCANLR